MIMPQIHDLHINVRGEHTQADASLVKVNGRKAIAWKLTKKKMPAHRKVLSKKRVSRPEPTLIIFLQLGPGSSVCWCNKQQNCRLIAIMCTLNHRVNDVYCPQNCRISHKMWGRTRERQYLPAFVPICSGLRRSFAADKERQDDSQTIPWALRESN